MLIEVQPDTQQHVVERHVGFAPPQQMKEISPVDPRDFRAETFIKPEGLCCERCETNGSAGGDQQEEIQSPEDARSW